MLTAFQREVAAALRSDIDRLTATTPRTLPQRDYLAKLAADVLRISRQLSDRDGRAIAIHLSQRSFDDYLQQPDGKPGTFSIFETLFKKNAGGHFKPVEQVRAKLVEAFAVIDLARS